MRKRKSLLLVALIGAILLVGLLFTGAASAAPAQQIVKHMQIDGISAVQLTWWFQHIGDNNGSYWKPLSDDNKTIYWVVNPREDAHQVIGSLFESDQTVPGGLFPGDNLHSQIQFGSLPSLGHLYPASDAANARVDVPVHYTAPTPPVGRGPPSTMGSANMIFFDGHGFCGRILWSWKTQVTTTRLGR
jgi:hypothetical protein